MMQMQQYTLVLGASANPERYSYMAIQLLLEKGHPVYAIGSSNSTVHGVSIVTQPTLWPNVATVTLYLNPALQKSYYQYLMQLKPQRIIFNPGTENPELAALAQQNGIEILEACTLVMLRTYQY